MILDNATEAKNKKTGKKETTVMKLHYLMIQKSSACASNFVEMLVANHNEDHRMNGGSNKVPTLLVKEPPDYRRERHDDQSEESEDEVANEAEPKEEEHAGLEDKVVELVYVGKDSSDCFVEGGEKRSDENEEGFDGFEDGFENFSKKLD